VGPDYAGIAHITLTGPQIKATVDLHAGDTVDIVVNDEHEQVIVFPQIGEMDALRQELGVLERDQRFEDALGLGQMMFSGQQQQQ
jgi:hypothetical protein